MATTAQQVRQLNTSTKSTNTKAAAQPPLLLCRVQLAMQLVCICTRVYDYYYLTNAAQLGHNGQQHGHASLAGSSAQLRHLLSHNMWHLL
jgi:hypothetical protein